MKLVVESEISATSYKKLVARLRHLNKKQLWEILDHYIFHIISDADVTELLNILNEKALSENDNKIETAASALDDDLFYTIDPRERFRSPVISTIPSDENLEKFKNQLDLLYDQTCFENYIVPEIRQDVAKKLISFAETSDIPVLDHWTDFSKDEEGVIL
jgi:hypothetical protein